MMDTLLYQEWGPPALFNRPLFCIFLSSVVLKNLHIPKILCIFAPDFRAKLNAGTKRSLLILDHA